MSSLKDKLMSDAEEKRDVEIARQLGISVEELQSTEFEINEETNDDDLVLDTKIQFSKDSPKEILKKISGLGDDLSKSIRFTDVEDDF